MKKAIVGVFLLGLLAPSFGIERVGTTAFQFLKLPVGVRGIGMGYSFIAAASDASAMYWNPSGLGWMAQKEVMLTHINMPADINYNNLAFVLPLSQAAGTFGFNLAILYMNDLDVRTFERPEGTGSLFTASDLALSVAYSRQVSDRFTFGVLGKYIREELAGYTSSSVTFDAGLQYQTDFRSMRLGMVIQHFGPDASFSGSFPDYRTSVAFDEPQTLDFETAPTPINFKFGLVADFENFLGISLGENVTGNIAGQFEHPADARERINTGAEFFFNERFALRGGYGFRYDTDSFTLGFGVYVPLGTGGNKLRLDYAYADQGDLTDSSSFLNQPHRFSLAFQF